VWACVEAARSGGLAVRPWSGLLQAADAAGGRAGEAARARASALAEDAGEVEGAPARRRSREAEEASRRASRRARTEALDLGLALVAAWLRDLAAAGEGGEDIALNADRAAELRTASHLDPRRARRAAELVMETRRRLQVNVGEELALEALLFRMEAVLRGA
jgi:DNA polymerase III subunit delta'